MVIVLPNRDCLVCHWLYSGSNNIMIEKKYTLEEITGAWYECYGEYMEDEYEGFIQLLKNKKEEDENKGD